MHFVFLYLYAGLGQIDFEGHFLPHENIRVSGLGEQILQDVQLGSGESCALASLFSSWYTWKTKNVNQINKGTNLSQIWMTFFKWSRLGRGRLSKRKLRRKFLSFCFLTFLTHIHFRYMNQRSANKARAGKSFLLCECETHIVISEPYIQVKSDHLIWPEQSTP